MEERPLNSRLQEQSDKMEQLRKKRTAARSLYKPDEVQPLLQDILEFIDAQDKGARDLASITDSEFIATRSLHMSLMSGIIKQYIENQMSA